MYAISLAYLNVGDALEDIEYKWLCLGLVLGLPHHILEYIRVDCSYDAKENLKVVIKKWLEGKGSGEPPSWKSLCKALRDPLVSRSDMASSIEQGI